MKLAMRLVLAAALSLSLVVLPGCATSGKTAPAEPEASNPLEGLDLRIETSQHVGLVPLELEITGRCLDRNENDVPLTEDRRVRLHVETSHYRIVSGDRSTPFHTAGIDEIDAAGLKNPMVRSLRINRPGTYRFQFILEDLTGNQLRSNTIQVKAM
ncbi:MAG: hypothetical protein PVF68_01695 [Acidobacteriota bacterium]|jgi:hypothetical protein